MSEPWLSYKPTTLLVLDERDGSPIRVATPRDVARGIEMQNVAWVADETDYWHRPIRVYLGYLITECDDTGEITCQYTEEWDPLTDSREVAV